MEEERIVGVQLNPYLSFRDTAREAMEFYRSVFGGELTTATFAEFEASEDPSEADKIMHSTLDIGDDLLLMGADMPNSMPYEPGGGFAISLSGDDEDRLRRYWEGLRQGATIQVPLEPAEWGDVFGMLVDKYGVRWMVNIAGETAQS